MVTARSSPFLRIIPVLIAVCFAGLPAQAQYSGGTGEPNDPYQIATAADLIALGETPEDYDKHFILTADIDLDPNLPGRKVFDKAVIAPNIDDTQDGFQGTPFTGVFDGNGHTILHLTIAGIAYLGLFGQLGSWDAPGCEIKNLGLADCNITGTGLTGIGALAGYNHDGVVTECYSAGKVRSTGSGGVGGLVGGNWYGTLTHCYSTAAVSGDSAVGGLVAGNGGTVTDSYSAGAVGGRDLVGGVIGLNSGSIARCSSRGTVTGTDRVGGLVGYNRGGGVTSCYSAGAVGGTGSGIGGLVGSNGAGPVTRSYSTGAVSGQHTVGGLIGSNWGDVTGCYSAGAVAGDGNDVGGLVGYCGTGVSVTVCFWDRQTSGQMASAGGTGKTTAEMRAATTFLDDGWDFIGEAANGTEDIWKMAEGLGYPRLWWEKYSGGTGEPNDPYQIATAEDLMALGNESNDYDKHFILTADIDLDPNLPGRKVFDRAVIAPGELVCDMFGCWFKGIPFVGIFDGSGHTISHLTIRGASYVGLFGDLGSGAGVRALALTDVNIIGCGDSVGALAGVNAGRVTNCSSTGMVRAGYDVGGLVGVNGLIVGVYKGATLYAAGTMTECFSTCVVIGACSVGGLAGSNPSWMGHIVRCFSAGAVSGIGRSVGGLVGYNGGPVTDCYSKGSVTGAFGVGGLVGDNSGTYGEVNGEYGLITMCYSVGSVAGTGTVGGLVGCRPDDVIDDVIASFWDIQTSGQAASAGGTGKTTAEMQTAKTFLDAGWDFVGEAGNGTEDIWKIAEGLDYPRLWWEPYEGRVTVVLGQVFTVTLESNPSTGYRWEWVDHQDSIVEQMGEAQFKPRETGDLPLVGAGGWESFDFKAVNPGQMTLKLVYRRLWEEGVEPLKTFSLQVTVP